MYNFINIKINLSQDTEIFMTEILTVATIYPQPIYALEKEHERWSRI